MITDMRPEESRRAPAWQESTAAARDSSNAGVLALRTADDPKLRPGDRTLLAGRMVEDYASRKRRTRFFAGRG